MSLDIRTSLYLCQKVSLDEVRVDLLLPNRIHSGPLVFLFTNILYSISKTRYLPSISLVILLVSISLSCSPACVCDRVCVCVCPSPRWDLERRTSLHLNTVFVSHPLSRVCPLHTRSLLKSSNHSYTSSRVRQTVIVGHAV